MNTKTYFKPHHTANRPMSPSKEHPWRRTSFEAELQAFFREPWGDVDPLTALPIKPAKEVA